MQTFTPHPFQLKAIHSLAKSNIHLIVQAPTGSGKSFIFQETTRKYRYRTLLFSPLIALARQQAQRAKEMDIPVGIYSGGEKTDPPKDFGLWIMSPEVLFSFQNKDLIKRIENFKPDLLVMDECHCIWDWGNSFRPSILDIPKMIEIFKIPRSLWLTATLTPNAKKDLLTRLPEPKATQGGFRFSKNINLSEKKLSLRERINDLKKLVSDPNQYGIFFVQTRKRTLWLREELNLGDRIAYYHAGMASEERLNIEKKIRDQKVQWICATSAFGLGMDFTHFKHSVVLEIPPSVSALAQFLGRVGRGNTIGNARFYWDASDFQRMRSIIKTDQQIVELKEFWSLLAFNPDSDLKSKIECYFKD